MAAHRLVGRGTELERLATALTQAGAGAGSVAVIEGAPGVGKTSLLDALAGQAQQSGFRVARARAAELDQVAAFGVVRQIFGPIAFDAATWSEPGMPSLLPALDALAGVRTDIDPASLRQSLLVLLRQLCRRSPVLITIDDAQWADLPSLEWAYAASLVARELPLLVAVGTHPAATAPRPLLHLLRAADTLLLTPAALDSGDAARVLTDCLGRPPDPELLTAALAATGGNPFLLTELGRELTRVDASTITAQDIDRMVPRRVAAAAAVRLHRLSPAAQQLALSLAVLESASIEVAADLAGLSLLLAAAAADELTAAAMLAEGRPLAFRHSLVRTALYAGIGRSVLSVQHRRAATILARRDPGAETIVAHLLRTEPAGDQWTATQLHTAGVRAIEGGAPTIAVTLLTRALEEPPPPELRAACHGQLGLALVRCGDPAGITHLHTATAAATDVEDRVAWTTAVAEALTTAGDCAGAVRALDAVRATVEDPELRLDLDARVVSAAFHDPALAPLARERLAALPRLSGRTPGERRIITQQLIAAVFGGVPAAVCLDLADRALGAAHDTTWPIDSFGYAAVRLGLAVAGDLDRSARLLSDGVAQAGRTGSLAGQLLCTVYRGQVATWQGDLDQAEADAESGAWLIAQLPTSAALQNFVLGYRTDVFIARGDLDAGDAALAAHVAARPDGDHGVAAYLHRASGLLRLARRDWAGAYAELAVAGSSREHSLFGGPSLSSWRDGAAVALHHLGRRAEAQQLIGQDVAFARGFGAPHQLGSALRVAAYVADPPEGLALAHEAEEVLRTSGAQLTRARAELTLGMVLRHTGARTEAVGWLLQGRERAAACGAHGVVADAEGELRLAGSRPRRVAVTGVAALTPAERRVCELAAGGETNREIATSLFITTKTVELHLSRSYRKLAVRRRGDLIAALTDC